MTLPGKTQTRVLLIEDHALTRDGLRVAINFESDLKVIGEARSGEEGLELLAQMSSDPELLLAAIRAAAPTSTRRSPIACWGPSAAPRRAILP